MGESMTTKLMTQIFISLLAAIGISANAFAEVKFIDLPAKLRDGSYRVPGDKDNFLNKPDFAYIDKEGPKLTEADRRSITVPYLKSLNQEKLDQLYARLVSGPIPTGNFRGSVISRNEIVLKIEDRILKEALDKKGIWVSLAKWVLGKVCGTEDKIDCFAELLWSGKQFRPPNEYGEIELRNAISPKMKWSMITRPLKLEGISHALKNVKPEKFYDEKRLMLFPAQVYCGLSLLDARRESVIIDYAYGDDFKDFIPEVDGLVARNGSWIRDEIRMIRPGLYLGRAYVDKIFLLNFVLENKDLENGRMDVAENMSCWKGDSYQ